MGREGMSEAKGSTPRSTTSLLVRCWLEPQPRQNEAPVLRGYVKNLKTGEESYIGDVQAIGQQVLRYLQSEDLAVPDQLVVEGNNESSQGR